MELPQTLNRYETLPIIYTSHNCMINMNKSELQEVMESINRGDKVTLGALDFDFTVTQTQYVYDPDTASSAFGDKDHYPEDGFFTKVLFGIDAPHNNPDIQVTTYGEKNYEDKINEETYDTLESISVVERRDV